MTNVEWTGGDRIGEILDVTTGACTYCRGAARVPEDVVAVVENPDGRKQAFIVCEECQPGFMAEARERIRAAMEAEFGPPEVDDAS